jgi:peptide/nickel transport system permease protein
MAMAGVTMRMTRTMMLEVQRQDYIRTAWSKGLRERVVVVGHALKNALIPIVTILGINLGIVIGGTVIIEEIFVLPGMGRLLFESVSLRDYTVVNGVVLCFGVAMVLINLLVDLTYAYLDPRIQYR